MESNTHTPQHAKYHRGAQLTQEQRESNSDLPFQNKGIQTQSKDTARSLTLYCLSTFGLLLIPQISNSKTHIIMIIPIHAFIFVGFLLPGSKGTNDLAPLFNYCRMMSPVSHHLFGSFPVRRCWKAPRTSK